MTVPFLTCAQAARRLGVSGETLRAYCRRGLIGRRLLGRYRLDPAEVDALLAGRRLSLPRESAADAQPAASSTP
jgi:hypothetical protein